VLVPGKYAIRHLDASSHVELRNTMLAGHGLVVRAVRLTIGRKPSSGLGLPIREGAFVTG
jgi:hypothetical protein